MKRLLLLSLLLLLPVGAFAQYPATNDLSGTTARRVSLSSDFPAILVIDGAVTSGTFTITFNGQTTSAQAYNVSAATLQSALEGLSTVGAGNVTVLQSSRTYTIRFLSSVLGLVSATNLSWTPSLVGSSASALTPYQCTPSKGEITNVTVNGVQELYACTALNTWSKLARTKGVYALNDCAKFDAAGNIISNGASCGGGSGSVTSIATTSPITGGTITATGTIACATCVTSAASLTSNQLVIGGGSQASAALGSLGTTTTVLHGNAAGAPTFGAVSLANDTTGTLGLTKGGTGLDLSGAAAGSLVYVLSSSSLAGTGVLTANAPLLGGGGGPPGTGTRSGNTTTFVTSTGTLTSGNCAKFDASGNLVDHGSACGGGSTPRLDQVLDPTSGKNFAMAALPLTFTFGNATGSGVDMVTFTDTSGNTGTGDLVMINTAATSNAKPITITARGTANGISMGTGGVVSALGTGGIDPAALVTTAGLVPDGALSTNVPLVTGTNTFVAKQTTAINDGSNSAVTDALDLQHSTTGTAAIGVGVGIRFGLERASGTTNVNAANQKVTFTDVSASPTAKFSLELVNAGTVAERMSVAGNGDTMVKGTLTAGSSSTVLTDSAGKVLSAALNTVGVAQGGTGATTLTGVLKGNGTSAFTAATAGTDFTSPSSTETQTNKTLDAEGTGNVITVPTKIWLPAAGCNNATAGPMWDLPASTPAVAACVTGTNIQKGVLDFADTSGGFSAQNTLILPSDFSGNIDVRLVWFTTVTSGNVKWSVSTACTDVGASATDDPTFNTPSTVTTAVAGTASRVSSSTITSLTATGCSAGNLLHIKVFRDGNDGSDTATGATVRLVGLEATIRRAM